MTDEQIRELGPAFSAYLRPYFEFCNQKRTAAHLGDYCRALLSDAPRKTAEPNALAAGAAMLISGCALSLSAAAASGVVR